MRSLPGNRFLMECLPWAAFLCKVPSLGIKLKLPSKNPYIEWSKLRVAQVNLRRKAATQIPRKLCTGNQRCLSCPPLPLYSCYWLMFFCDSKALFALIRCLANSLAFPIAGKELRNSPSVTLQTGRA